MDWLADQVVGLVMMQRPDWVRQAKGLRVVKGLVLAIKVQEVGVVPEGLEKRVPPW